MIRRLARLWPSDARRHGMRRPIRPGRRVRGAVLLAVAAAAGAAASGATATVRPPLATPAKAAVSVLYAGSLVDYMEDDLGPAFSKATGFGYQGYGAGSTEVASQIRGGVRQGDVFVSASRDRPTPCSKAPANGNWVSLVRLLRTTAARARLQPEQQVRRPAAAASPGTRSSPSRGSCSAAPTRHSTRRACSPPGGRQRRRQAARPGAPEPALSSSARLPGGDASSGGCRPGQLDAGFFYASEAKAAQASRPSRSRRSYCRPPTP